MEEDGLRGIQISAAAHLRPAAALHAFFTPKALYDGTGRTRFSA